MPTYLRWYSCELHNLYALSICYAIYWIPAGFTCWSKCEWNTKEKCCLRMLVNKGNPPKPGPFGFCDCSGWLPAACLDGWPWEWESAINQDPPGTTRKWRRQWQRQRHLEQQQKPKTICTQRRQQMLLRCCLVLLTAAIWWRWLDVDVFAL